MRAVTTAVATAPRISLRWAPRAVAAWTGTAAVSVRRPGRFWSILWSRMRSGGCGSVERCAPSPDLLLHPRGAVCGIADVSYAEAKSYLCSREARQMSESDLERELDRRGRALLRKLLQGHLDQRRPGEAAGPVAGADGVERSERRVHERRLETTFGTVAVERTGYARVGHDMHPLDAALNLPPERYSLEVRRRVAVAAASRSFDEALFELSAVPPPRYPSVRRNARAAADFDAFYEARQAERGRCLPRGRSVTFDGKGVVLHRDDLREATRKAAENARDRELSLFTRLKPGEKKHAKRMATVAAVYTTAPFVRSPEEFLQSLMPPQPAAARAKARTRSVRPRPVAKRVASVEREPLDVVAEATLAAEHRDPEHVKHWVALVVAPRRSSSW